jgi:hypothetical protein
LLFEVEVASQRNLEVDEALAHPIGRRIVSPSGEYVEDRGLGLQVRNDELKRAEQD